MSAGGTIRNIAVFSTPMLSKSISSITVRSLTSSTAHKSRRVDNVLAMPPIVSSGVPLIPFQLIVAASQGCSIECLLRQRANSHNSSILPFLYVILLSSLTTRPKHFTSPSAFQRYIIIAVNSDFADPDQKSSLSSSPAEALIKVFAKTTISCSSLI